VDQYPFKDMSEDDVVTAIETWLRGKTVAQFEFIARRLYDVYLEVGRAEAPPPEPEDLAERLQAAEDRARRLERALAREETARKRAVKVSRKLWVEINALVGQDGAEPVAAETLEMVGVLMELLENGVFLRAVHPVAKNAQRFVPKVTRDGAALVFTFDFGSKRQIEGKESWTAHAVLGIGARITFDLDFRIRRKDARMTTESHIVNTTSLDPSEILTGLRKHPEVVKGMIEGARQTARVSLFGRDADLAGGGPDFFSFCQGLAAASGGRIHVVRGDDTPDTADTAVPDAEYEDA
jgi:hypothetical protein